MITGNTEATINHLQDLLDEKDEQIKEVYKAVNSLRIDLYYRSEMAVESSLEKIEELLRKALLSNNNNEGEKYNESN